MTTSALIEELPIERTPPPNGSPFLTATWRDLLMLNFDVDASVLAPYVPEGVELGLHEGRALASIVAFIFEKPRLYGVPAPFFKSIPEVNLRFYVQRNINGCRRQGVVFIKEIAPWRALPMAAVANHWYHENYQLMSVRHQLYATRHGNDARHHVHYSWRYRGHWNHASATAIGEPHRPTPGSEEGFVLDHWFACTRQPDGTGVERQVDHVPWTLRPIEPDSLSFHCDVARLYGSQFVDALSQPPTTAFFSRGSSVGVFVGMPV